MSKIPLATNEELRGLRAAAAQAIADLDQIIANAETLDAQQVRAAIKKLSQHQKRMIKRLVQL